MFNKRAQIGETMTWIVATIVILVLLIITVSLVSFITKSKEFKTNDREDLLVTKSMAGYLLTEREGKKIYDELGEESLDELYASETKNVNAKIGEFGTYYLSLENSELMKNIFGKLYLENDGQYSRGEGGFIVLKTKGVLQTQVPLCDAGCTFHDGFKLSNGELFEVGLTK